ncbi:D-beta-hydroxybutyrate dehydrogenase [Nocardioides dokdonensis FR1436]|uniref:D-beta-hydroxybutyrate dehydrogenase n=1 Tax=Nocardioides dokdonensis FR1436 TaxID=1300347 RepID=A0A1A9GLQ4_9ACTN|nr:3-hydroxybutyrate dehydrogenase [Nocardioides dokdonensis]ANH39219.1 D-beta-hydroxybutyrate dehydrogenase [Nocardioides dokdonensis FR1436]
MSTVTATTPALLEGRRALVTGGASGIGAAVAEALAAQGAHVVVVDRDEAGAQKIADLVGGSAVAADLTDPAAIEAMDLDVDILVNNAGIQHVAPVHELDPAKFQQVHDLMLRAPFLLARGALPGMYERGWGRLVHVSSVHGLRASAFKSAYVSAKHGLEGLSKVLAVEGAAHGVTSNTVNPGYVRTPLVEGQIADQARVHGLPEDRVLDEVLLARTPLKRLVEPAEVAGLVTWLCGPHSASVTGTSHVMDGGWTAT